MLSCLRFKAVNRSLHWLILGVVALVAPRMEAAQVIVGVFSFDNLIPGAPGSPGVNAFTIDDLTGANSQPGTPDSAIDFQNVSVLLNGTSSVTVGDVTPGAAQPMSLQFPSNQVFTDATLSATLDTLLFTIAGQDYLASSDVLSADLMPATPPDLSAGSDFVLLSIDASPVQVSAAPEPKTQMLLACASLLFVAILMRRASGCLPAAALASKRV